ncbi:MAG: hypothetical protein ILA15_06700 [Clostridiales bacterium]|nr:hypothetical protein [Clostridiales bacterium]
MKLTLHGEIFFMADTHFCHDNIIVFNNRPFTSTEEMEDKIINNINDVVPKNGSFIFVGDFSCHINKEKVRELRNRINCKNIHFVTGNHDKDYTQDHIFNTVSDRIKLICNDLCQYQYLVVSENILEELWSISSRPWPL